ncbi:TetR/AcrR family transcriptional regulator [Paenibacillus sp. NPDC056579]|uniref:TetR/AcrR family transcriptional regulator n=1 Tax=Paenibacillus sp. NPDC056579 TaxID=3345871 RepID=UPI003683DB3C
MDKTTDRRKIRTKRLLRKALLELMDEKGLDKVTVRDLTERAEVNRGTFYLHYKDIYDLMDQIKKEIFDGLAAEMSKIVVSDIAKYADKQVPYPPAVHLLQYFRKQYDFFRVILGPNGDIAFPYQIRMFMAKQMHNQVLVHIPNDDSALVPRDYLVAFITSAQLGLLTHWIQSGMSLPEEKVAIIIARIMYKGPIMAAFPEGLWSEAAPSAPFSYPR